MSTLNDKFFKPIKDECNPTTMSDYERELDCLIHIIHVQRVPRKGFGHRFLAGRGNSGLKKN